jgi:predicted Zn-dependent peptidase
MVRLYWACRSSRALLVALLVTGEAAASGVVGRWVEKTTEFQLDNGLRVVVLDRSSSSGVSFSLLSKAGWADDPADRRGLSAIVAESVMEGGFAFGSRNVAEERKVQAEAEAAMDKWEAEMAKPEPDELLASRLKVDAEAILSRLERMADRATFATQMTAAGGTLLAARNDATVTVFQATLPTEQAEVWFTGMGGWLRDPSWRDFYRHRQVIATETTRPLLEETVLLNALAAKAFAKHAWGAPALDLNGIQKVRLRAAAAFQRAAFAPGNMVLAVAGDLPVATVRALAQKHFGGLAAQPPMKHEWTDRPEKQYVMPPARPGFEAMAIGYKRSPVNSPDDAVLDVISHLLSSGPDSYLQNRLVQTRKVGAVLGAASFPSNAGGGLLSVIAVPVPGTSFDQLRTLVQGAIAELAEKRLPESDLLAAKRFYIASAVRGMESDVSATDFLARSVAELGTVQATADVLKQLESVSPADVQRVAKQYLQDDASTWVTWAGERR